MVRAEMRQAHASVHREAPADFWRPLARTSGCPTTRRRPDPDTLAALVGRDARVIPPPSSPPPIGPAPVMPLGAAAAALDLLRYGWWSARAGTLTSACATPSTCWTRSGRAALAEGAPPNERSLLRWAPAALRQAGNPAADC